MSRAAGGAASSVWKDTDFKGDQSMTTQWLQTLDAGRSPAPADPRLARFVNQWAVRLTTFKRDGTPVGTAVNIVVDGDHAFVRSFERAWKARRMRNDPNVEIAPATWRGNPTGPAIKARARLLDGVESEQAGRLIDAKHPLFQRLLVRFGHKLLRHRTLHYEIRPVDDVSRGAET
jgi:uncharacterized protein